MIFMFFTIYMGKLVGPRPGQMVCKKSGLVNLVPESRLPFVQISSIYQKTTEGPETGIKYGFEEIEHNFPLEDSVQKNRTTF